MCYLIFQIDEFGNFCPNFISSSFIRNTPTRNSDHTVNLFFNQLILSFSLICVWLVVFYLMFRMCAFNITSCIKFCLHLHHVLQATQTFNVKTKMNNHLHHQTNRQDIQYHYFKSQIVEYLPAFQIILFRHHSPSDEPGLRVTHTMNLVSKP